MKTFSVVIPCFNYAQYLGEAIESVLNQALKASEIIVVDDGSTDNTPEVASRYPVKYIRTQNMGVSHARNVGIKSASGSHILPLDADDTIHPSYLSIANESSADIVGCWVNYFGRQNGIWPYRNQNPGIELFRERQVSPSCSIFAKYVWETLGGYDEEMKAGEDWDFFARAAFHGYSFQVLPKALINYRKHGPSLSDFSRANCESIKSRITSKIKGV